jgi:hypothetical protein
LSENTIGKIGNVFHTKDIEAAIEMGRKYNPDVVGSPTSKSMRIDPVYGSSAFGIVVTQWIDNHIQYCIQKSIIDLITMKCYLWYTD